MRFLRKGNTFKPPGLIGGMDVLVIGTQREIYRIHIQDLAR